MEFIVPNFKVVSVVITPSSGNTPASTIFPTQQDLQNRKIIAIETYTSEDMSTDPNNAGTNVITPAIAQGCFVTLYNSAVTNRLMWNQKQEPGLFYDLIPYQRLRAVSSELSTNTGTFTRSGLFIIRPTEMAFNKCNVLFPSPVAIGGVYSAVFGFHYLDKDDDGEWWMDAMGYKGNKK